MATSVPAPTWSAPQPEHQRRGREVGRVLVLNATYEPINVCTVRRAVVLLLKEKAEVIEHGELQLHSATYTMTRPVVIRLCQLRSHPARHPPAQDHPARCVRARRLDVPVLRVSLEPDRRSRDPALQGRLLELGQHRRVVRSVQPAQGRPASEAGGDAALPGTANAEPDGVHPRRQPDDPRRLAAVPGCLGLRAFEHVLGHPAHEPCRGRGSSRPRSGRSRCRGR